METKDVSKGPKQESTDTTLGFDEETLKKIVDVWLSNFSKDGRPDQLRAKIGYEAKIHIEAFPHDPKGLDASIKTIEHYLENQRLPIAGQPTIGIICDSIRMALITPEQAENANSDLFDRIYGDKFKTAQYSTNSLLPTASRTEIVARMQQLFGDYCKPPTTSSPTSPTSL